MKQTRTEREKYIDSVLCAFTFDEIKDYLTRTYDCYVMKMNLEHNNGMFVGGVALAKAKEEPETRMRYKDFTDYLRRFTANNFGLFVGDKPLTEEMIEVDLEHNKLTINV